MGILLDEGAFGTSPELQKHIGGSSRFDFLSGLKLWSRFHGECPFFSCTQDMHKTESTERQAGTAAAVHAEPVAPYAQPPVRHQVHRNTQQQKGAKISNPACR